MPRRRAGGLGAGLARALLPALALAAGACSRAVAPESPAPPAPPPPPVEQVPPTPPPKPARPDTTPVLPDPLPRPERPSPARRERASVRLAFTGDINLGTSTLPGGIPPDSGRGLFERVRSDLIGDLVIGNLEGVLADTGTSSKCRPPEPPRRPPARQRRRPVPPAEPPKNTCYAFLTPTHLAPRLADAGFTHLNLANNHANDYGPAGRRSTEATLRRLGLKFYGPLGHIAVDSVRRGDSLTTIALVGFTTYPHSYDLLDIARSTAVVDSVRRLVDLVVVTFHGGGEGISAVHVPEAAESLGLEPRGDLRRWTRAVIDAGADVVVGHGPHVLRGMEFYRGKLIVYSLGNFLTYRGFNLRGPLGITGVLQLEIAPDRTLRVARLVPMRQVAGLGVVRDPDSTAIEIVRRLSAEDFREAGARVSGDGGISVP